MKYFYKLFLLVFFVFLGNQMNSQDLLKSYFQFAPLSVNPAQTGNFYGTARIGAFYRGQWQGVDGFNTSNIYIDAPIGLKFLGKKNWIGVGINFISDKAGMINFGTTGGGLGLTFNRLLGKKGNGSISFGVSMDRMSMGGNTDSGGFTSGGSIANNGNDSDLNGFLSTAGNSSGLSSSFTDFNFGIILKNKINKKSNYEFGIAAQHLLEPGVNFNIIYPGMDTTGTNRGDTDKILRTYSSTFIYSTEINKRLRIEPGLYAQVTGGSFTTTVHAILKYLLDPKKQVVLNGGLGVREDATVNLLFGADIKDFRIGASFNINNTGFSGAQGLQNAFELGASYIIKYYKQPKVKPVLFCPRL